MATQHVVSRSVRDSAAILECTAGTVSGDPYSAPAPERGFLAEVTTEPGVLRAAFATEGPDGRKFAEPMRTSVIATARLLEDLGHKVEEVSPTWDSSLMGEAIGSIAACALAETVTRRERETGTAPSEETLEQANLSFLARGRSMSALDLMDALRKVNIVSRRFASFFETHDVWLTPTMGEERLRSAFLTSSSSDVDLLMKRFSDLYRFNSIYNASGLPAITLPLHVSPEGLPIGIMLGAGFGNEGSCFAWLGNSNERRHGVAPILLMVFGRINVSQRC